MATGGRVLGGAPLEVRGLLVRPIGGRGVSFWGIGGQDGWVVVVGGGLVTRLLPSSISPDEAPRRNLDLDLIQLQSKRSPRN